ncbi:ASCH domain-containing protein [Dehalococcoidia bacterium]|nr:ASCH domain-containing protein [Dehalococcoidia bacterium]
MKALSIRQPWAWLIVNGYKDIENRTWSTDFRGRIYVHTGQKIKSGDFPEQRDYIRESEIILPEEPPLGAIVGEVTIADCVDCSSSPWFCGPYGFLLTSPVAYTNPIPYRGNLRFFEVEEETVSRYK